MHKRSIVVGALLLLSSLPVRAQIVGTAHPLSGHVAPLTTIPDWWDNVCIAIRNGQTDADQGDWTKNYYAVHWITGPVAAQDSIYGDIVFGGSSFWRAKVNQPAPFNGDEGTAGFFGFQFKGSGSLNDRFSLSQIRGFAGSLPHFSTTVQGQYWGPDRNKATTADNVIYNLDNPGDANTLVDEVDSVGNSSGYHITYDPATTPTQQAIDTEMATIQNNGPRTFSITYTVVNPTTGAILASVTPSFTVTPEPSALALLGFGAMALCGRRNRK